MPAAAHSRGSSLVWLFLARFHQRAQHCNLPIGSGVLGELDSNLVSKLAHGQLQRRSARLHGRVGSAVGLRPCQPPLLPAAQRCTLSSTQLGLQRPRGKLQKLFQAALVRLRGAAGWGAACRRQGTAAPASGIYVQPGARSRTSCTLCTRPMSSPALFSTSPWLASTCLMRARSGSVRARRSAGSESEARPLGKSRRAGAGKAAGSAAGEHPWHTAPRPAVLAPGRLCCTWPPPPWSTAPAAAQGGGQGQFCGRRRRAAAEGEQACCSVATSPACPLRLAPHPARCRSALPARAPAADQSSLPALATGPGAPRSSRRAVGTARGAGHARGLGRCAPAARWRRARRLSGTTLVQGVSGAVFCFVGTGASPSLRAGWVVPGGGARADRAGVQLPVRLGVAQL